VRDSGDAALARRRQFTNHVRQGHRIGPAGHGKNDTGARMKETVLGEKPADARQQLHEIERSQVEWLAAPAYLPSPPNLPQGGAGGRTRTVDPALMRRVLSPTELLRQNHSCYPILEASSLADS
jgi:hypothetical protein